MKGRQVGTNTGQSGCLLRTYTARVLRSFLRASSVSFHPCLRWVEPDVSEGPGGVGQGRFRRLTLGW